MAHVHICFISVYFGFVFMIIYKLVVLADILGYGLFFYDEGCWHIIKYFYYYLSHSVYAEQCTFRNSIVT